MKAGQMKRPRTNNKTETREYGSFDGGDYPVVRHERGDSTSGFIYLTQARLSAHSSLLSSVCLRVVDVCVVEKKKKTHLKQMTVSLSHTI